jgi:hypothetical protein
MFHQNPTKITAASDEDVFTFMTMFGWFLIRMRYVSNKSHLGENVKKYGACA